jgi:hypothetical protein
MVIATPLRETRDDLIKRAKDALRLARSETIPNRAMIHIQAAETWLMLASRKPKRLAKRES